MLRNYLKTALRNLWHQKVNTSINLSGLTLGIASSLVLFLLIRHHLSFDTFHTREARIYRVVTDSDGNEGRRHTPGVPSVLPEAFKDDFPEAEDVTFISYRAGSLVTVPQPQGEVRKFEEEQGVAFTDPSFFRIFDRGMLEGDAVKGIDEPNEAIISRKLAIKYFNDEAPIGKIVKYDNKEYKISAVMSDTPSNTDFPFELLLSFSTIKKENLEAGWGSIWSDEQCFFSLKQNVRIDEVQNRMPAFYKKYHKENLSNQAFVLQPLNQIHFDDEYGNYNYNTVSKQSLLALGIIAIFLVVSAAINFINLTTAEAVKRSREIGIRKSLGSSRAQLIAQFLGETTLVTFVSVLTALVCAQLAISFLNPFLGLQLTLSILSDGILWVFLISITIIVAILSGLYPSIVVSGLNVTSSLKNQIDQRGTSGFNLRRSLVIMQFFISQFFVFGTLILIDQMHYLQTTELGFRKDAIITVPLPVREVPSGDGASKMRTLRDELSKLSGVEGASMSNTPPSSGSVGATNFRIEGSTESHETQVKTIDGHYVELFGLELVAGGNLQDLDTAQGFLVNERLSAMVGTGNHNEILGKKIEMWGKTLPIVGVLKDFHTVSLHAPIEATILLNRIRDYRALSLKLNPASMSSTIKKIQSIWETTYPEFIFSYEFMDEQIKHFYDGEQKMSVLLGAFTSMAIFIGCLGLFGLATFMANQRTKEIGVRKVLGASVESIVILFSREYIKLILIGFVLAAPVSWYVMNQWLNGFAYKITIGPVVFMSGIGLTVLIAICTVGYRSFKAAIVNPADSLKTD